MSVSKQAIKHLLVNIHYNMYSKLIVSSLESRALNSDQHAIAELVSRSKQGMKRARLAIERLLKLKLPIETRDQLLGYKYSPETILLVRQISAPCDPAGQDSWEDLQRVTKTHTNDKDLVSTIEREEFERYGDLTAQQIDNEKKGMK